MKPHTLKEFLYKMFLTRDDDFDPLQILFAAIIIVALVVSWNLTITSHDISDSVKIESMITLRWLAGLLVLTAVPKWLVPTVADVMIKRQPEPLPQLLESNDGISQESVE